MKFTVFFQHTDDVDEIVEVASGTCWTLSVFEISTVKPSNGFCEISGIEITSRWKTISFGKTNIILF